MQVARSLAGTVSQVHDPIDARRNREQSERAAWRFRLWILQALVPKPKRAIAPCIRIRQTADCSGDRGTTLPMLCLLALRDEEARDFLRGQNWREVLAQMPGAELLVRILESDLRRTIRPRSTRSWRRFRRRRKRLVSAWLLQKMPAKALSDGEKWWMGIAAGSLATAAGGGRKPNEAAQLSTGEVVNLQKQILDLREQLHELSKLSPARRAAVKCRSSGGNRSVSVKS